MPLSAVLTYQARYQAERHAARKPVPVEAWSEDYVLKLRGSWQDFLRLDLAQSTDRSYNWHVSQYLKFCAAAGVPATPDALVLAQFVVGRAQHGYAVSTIELGVYAVARWVLDAGMEGLASELVVRRALKVAAKLAVPTGKQKLPLDRQDLRLVVAALRERGRQDFVGVRDAALFLLGWTGMFRSSELVGIDWDVVRPIPQRGGVLLYVPYSKTDQAGVGAWVFIACCEDEEMCPVQALWRLRRLAVKDAQGSPIGPVFTAWEGKQRRLAKTTVGVRLQKALQSVGVQNWDLYAAHSLRRGGATWAVRQGVSVRQIMVMGRWKSDVVREYLYHSPTELLGASRQQQQG
eukprot:GHRQ01008676.1.p1 GENE.GHRQ01008676.1~~GHRQ01008676.1.p1  ORF type:complete len:348 (-),score=64.88 GHRQ01008676.1:210-1253(-)